MGKPADWLPVPEPAVSGGPAAWRPPDFLAGRRRHADLSARLWPDSRNDDERGEMTMTTANERGGT